MTATPAEAAPLPERHHHPAAHGAWAAFGWWSAIAVLSVADGIGFHQNISVLLKNGNAVLLWVIVLTCSLAAVLLPWIFGQALIQRQHGTTNTGLVIAAVATIWAGLGATMFVVRVTASSVAQAKPSLTPGDKLFTDASTDGGRDAWLVAALLLLVFCSTAVAAAKHSYDVADRRTVSHFLDRRRKLVKRLRREREAHHQEEHLRRVTEQQEDLLAQARLLEIEATQAFANLEYEEKLDAIIQQLQDPVSTETVVADYERRSARRQPQP